jgi:hypothetical protein
MPSDRQTRRQRHQVAVKPQRGKAVRGAQSTEFVKDAGFRKSEFVGGKKYYTPMSTDPKSSGAGGDITNITLSGGSANAAVLHDGTIPFTKAQFGILPTETAHIATKGYVDSSDAGKLTEVIDAAATPGTGGQHGNLPGAAGTVGGHVCLVEDGGGSHTQAVLYNVASGNSNLTIEDDEDASGNAFIKFTAQDQSVSLHRFDTVYTYNSGNENRDTAPADGADGIAFVDTANTTWTAVTPAASGAYQHKAKVSLVTLNDNTTYSTNASTVSGGANFNLLAANPTSTDALKFAGTGATTVTRTDASTITISSSAGVTSIIDANDPGGSSYKSLVVEGSAGAAELIKVKGSGATSVAVTTQGDPVEYFLDISSSNTQRAIDDSPTDGSTTTSISSNWAYDNVKTAVPVSAVFTDTNYYLDGITKSGNTLTFSVSGGASYDETYTFGSNAFNSTAFLTAISSTLATDESASPPRVSILDDGSTVKALEEGTGISIEESATAGGDTVKISSTVDTSGLLTNGIVTIEDSSDDTQNAAGGDILKFAEDSTSTVGWAVTKVSNTITITPSLSGYNNSNWNTAHGWGDHGSAGYITGNQTITLSGDATGSGTTGITVVVANDSHTHDTRYYTESEMNTSLALKANLSSPTFTGTVTCEVIRLSSQTDVSATSTGHGLQIGPTNGYNFAIDNNELIARNNGGIATLHLSPDGGPTSGSYDNIAVTMNHNVSGGRINIYENGDIDCLNLKARADVWAYTSSDVSLKDNRKLIESPLDMISKIGGYSFDWNSKAARHLKGHDYGVMANEIESVMPELVTTREDGIKAVRYDGIIPLLIEAIKELKEELDGIRKL